MSGYIVRFLWGQRGALAYDWIRQCHVPMSCGPEYLMKGFWVDDSGDLSAPVKFAGYGPTCSDRTCFWVPPGRITGVEWTDKEYRP